MPYDHIKQVLSDLEKVWRACPELRLCQLISNAADQIGWMDQDHFYLEDEALQKSLDKYLN